VCSTTGLEFQLVLVIPLLPAEDLLNTARVQGSLVDGSRDHDGRVEISKRGRVVVGSSLREDLGAWALLIGIWIGARSTFDFVGRRSF